MRTIKRDWLISASKKGVEARIRERESENLKIRFHLLEKLKNPKYLSYVARLCGYIMGDGSFEIRKEKNKGWYHHEIRFYPDNLEVGKFFILTFKELYKKEPSIKQLNNYYRIRVTSKVACQHLKEYGPFSSLNWRAPNNLLKETDLKIEFIRSIFDCEAHVGKKNIQFQSVSYNGIKDLKELLEDFNIKSKMYSYKRKNPNWNINYL